MHNATIVGAARSKDQAVKNMASVFTWRTALFLAASSAAVSVHAQTAPADYVTGYRYLDGGLLAGTISPAPVGQSNFLATRNIYDANGRLQKIESGYLASWQADTIAPANWSGFTVTKSFSYGYDANGRKVMEALAGGNGVVATLTHFSYDAFDRQTCTAIRMNPSAFGAPAPPACSLGAEGADGPDRITMNAYDDLNRVIQVRKAVGTSIEQAYVTYSYTADSMREYVIDANGNRTRFTYDGHDRQDGWYFPSSAPPPAGFNPATQATALATAGAASTGDYESYGYDDNGNRTSLRKRDGQIISYRFDALNRMWLKDAPGSAPDVYYGYDLRGLQTYARFGSATGQGVSNTYDGFGRHESSTIAMGNVSRTVGHLHDADGRRTRVTHPDGNFFVYKNDRLGRLTDILENDVTAVAGQTYYPMGRRWTQTRVGVATTYGYDNYARPASVADNLTGAASDVTATFGYNAANQIATRTRDNDTYDFAGHANGTFTYVANGLNQYASIGGVSLGYDANANLTSDGSTSYTYDYENRLVTASGKHSATLTYDPLGRLFQVVSGGSTTQFLYDGDELVAEYNGSGTLTQRYVHGAQSDDPLIWYEGGSVIATARRSLQADYQGSVVSVADASGNATSINRYDEYGVAPATNVGRFQYTGQVWLAELGLNHYKARFYDPRLGRFLQTDPIGYQADVNLYVYVNNDPLNRTDPTGLAPGDPFASPEAAADDVIRFINPTSIKNNVEHGGHIYEKNGAFYASTPVSQGRGAAVTHAVPVNAKGDYHTHGDYSKRGNNGQPQRSTKAQDQYDSDNFSSGDKQNSRTLQRATGDSDYKSYLGTPSGVVKEYNPTTRTQSELKVPALPPPPVTEYCGMKAGKCPL